MELQHGVWWSALRTSRSDAHEHAGEGTISMIVAWFT